MLRAALSAVAVMMLVFPALAGVGAFDPSCKAASDPEVPMPPMKAEHSGGTKKSGLVGASEGAKKICADFQAKTQKVCGDDMNAVSSDGSSVTSRDTVSEAMTQGANAVDANSADVTAKFNVCSEKYSDLQDDCKNARDAAGKGLNAFQAQIKNGSCDPENKLPEAKDNLAEAKALARDADSTYSHAEDKTKTTLAQNGQTASNMRQVASANASGDGDQAMLGGCTDMTTNTSNYISTNRDGSAFRQYKCAYTQQMWTTMDQCSANCLPK